MHNPTPAFPQHDPFQTFRKRLSVKRRRSPCFCITHSQMRLVAITHLSIGYLLNLFKNRSELTQTSLHLSKSFIFGKIAAFTLCFALFLFFVIFAEKVRFLRQKRTFSLTFLCLLRFAKNGAQGAVFAFLCLFVFVCDDLFNEALQRKHRGNARRRRE